MTADPGPRNPFATPTVDVEGNAAESTNTQRYRSNRDFTANRWARLAAGIQDLILTYVSAQVAMLLLEPWVTSLGNQVTFDESLGRLRYLVMLAFFWIFTYGLTYLLINGWLLVTRGQTVGKLICRIKIVRLDGSLPGVGQVLLRRSALPHLLGGPTPLGLLLALIDWLFVLREDRRCLHDLIARTRVVTTHRPRNGHHAW